MNRLLKTFVLWLLVLALPVQGYAAVMQMSCAPAMHEATEPAMVMPAEPGHHAGMHDVMQADVTPDVPAAADTPHPFEKQTHMKCSVCAAGCMSLTALPSTPDWPYAPVGSSLVVAAPAPAFLGHIPDGIKRPPKFPLV